MSTWADAACKFMDFVQKPNKTGAWILGVVAFLIVWLTPIGVLTYAAWVNTNRLENAISNLGKNCFHTVATRPN